MGGGAARGHGARHKGTMAGVAGTTWTGRSELPGGVRRGARVGRGAAPGAGGVAAPGPPGGLRRGGLAGADAGHPHGRRAGAPPAVPGRGRAGALPGGCAPGLGPPPGGDPLGAGPARRLGDGRPLRGGGAEAGGGHRRVLSLSGPTVRRQVQRLAARVRAAELATHRAWTAGQPPAPAGTRVVSPLYVEADGVWVKTQREPAHATGYELKCASAYEDWERVGEPTPGHPRPAPPPGREAGVLPPARPGGGALLGGGQPGPAPHLRPEPAAPRRGRAGTGPTGSTRRADVFPRVVRQRDGFHLARDAARGWGAEAGAQLYAALRAGDQPTTLDLLGLPAPPTAKALPAPAPRAARARQPRRPRCRRRPSPAARAAPGALVPAPGGPGPHRRPGAGCHPRCGR